jgi:hypothetical protein
LTEVNAALVDRAPAKGEFAGEPVNRLLVSAEDERGQRMGSRGNLAEGFVQRLVG